jgi:hypothetical protein
VGEVDCRRCYEALLDSMESRFSRFGIRSQCSVCADLTTRIRQVGPIRKVLASESSEMARIERDKATLKQQLNRKLQDHMYDDNYCNKQAEQHELCLGLGPPADAV